MITTAHPRESWKAPSTAATLERPSTKSAVLRALLSAGAFHIAWLYPPLAGFTLLYAWLLVRVGEHASGRVAFRLGLLNGMLAFGPHLAWFWNIFGFAAVALWAVLAFFTGTFALLLNQWQFRFGSRFLWVAAPICWTGLEYFRSEVYFLKFSWLSVGYAFSGSAGLLPVGALGVYGIGFLIFLTGAFAATRAQQQQWKIILPAVACVTLLGTFQGTLVTPRPEQKVRVAGIQLEFPPALEIPKHLGRVIAQHPDAELLVLSEYTFDSSIPGAVLDWCRENRKYLIAGGKDDSVRGNFYNTAFVVSPVGEIIFKQAKSVPIQFFKDGLPAKSQEVWPSPWGKIAIPVCYDLSYRRVTDAFVRQGAQAFIVPFMDVTDWGAQQHELHARIGPMRAIEHNTPIFRLGSSGISQDIDRHGRVRASGQFPGQQEVLAATLHLSRDTRIPLDHWLAPVCSLLTGLISLMFVVIRFQSRTVPAGS